MNESKTLEFKEDVSNSFLKTVSAFANYGTGRILFGVADDGSVVGVSNPTQACLTIENKINDSISPNPDYTLETSSNGVIALTVQEGLHKPYLYKAKAYKRNGSSTIEADHIELTRLILEGQNTSFDATPARIKDLSFDTLSHWLTDALGIANVTDDVLKTLELMKPDGAFNVAAELLSDANTFPGIDIARFGETTNIFLDRETFEGFSVLEQRECAIRMFRQYYQYEEVVGSVRELRELVPEEAFREAITNAIAHRQWDVDARIRIAMHPDRIEVFSPGSLPAGLAEEDYLGGQVSILRNPILGNVLYRLRLIERFGTGIQRIKDCYRKSNRKPSFLLLENSVRVTLPLIDDAGALTQDEAQVLDALRGRDASISAISQAAGFGKTKTQQLLKKLNKNGYVTITGAGRGTRYHAERR